MDEFAGNVKVCRPGSGAGVFVTTFVGPAFGSLGPTANCGFLPLGVKLWYSFAMLAGRLEIYTLIIFLFKVFSLKQRKSV